MVIIRTSAEDGPRIAASEDVKNNDNMKCIAIRNKKYILQR